MKFGSVCSGIEAASVAFEPLGWKAAWFSEIEPFPCAVLKHHYPNTPNHGDMTTLPEKIRSGEVEAPDLFCGGTPCQAFSVAGLRQSLSDDRGNLSLTFCEIANAIDHVRSARGEQPCIVFWENVPGVLSTTDNAFGCFLGALSGCDSPILPGRLGWTDAGVVAGSQRTVAWRVLDAQYFGLAQRRRRVFVVASARDGFNPAEVLLEFQGLRRDFAPSREAGERSPGYAPQGLGVGGELARALTAANTATGRLDPNEATFVTHSYTQQCRHCQRFFSQYRCSAATHGECDCPKCQGYCKCRQPEQPAICIKGAAIGRKPEAGPQYGETLEEMAYTQNCVDVHGVLTPAMQVRRLTPVECERLQGFPDGYTAIPWRGKTADQCPDGPRYKALGNSWAVPCVQWIGKRIQQEVQGKLPS